MRKKIKKAKILLSQKNGLLLSQAAVIVLMLAIPLFIFLSQQKTQTQQFAAPQTIQANTCGVNACFSCSNYVDGQPCSPYTGLQPNGIPYCIDANPTCNNSTPTFHVHMCQQNGSSGSNGNLSGTYRSFYQSGWGPINGCSDNCYSSNPCSSGSSGSNGSNGSTGNGSSGSLGSKSYTGQGSSNSAGSSNANVVTVAGSVACSHTGKEANQTDQTCKVDLTANNSNISWGIKSSPAPIKQVADQNNATSGVIGNPTTLTVTLDCSNTTNQTGTMIINFPSDQSLGVSTVKLTCSGGITVEFAITGLANPPGHNTRDISLTLVPTNNLQANPINIPGSVNYDPSSKTFKAVIPLTQIPPGNYQIKLHVDGTLDTQLIQPNGDNSFTFPLLNSSKLLMLIPGDIGPGQHGDNFIDIIDYNKLIGCIGKQPTSSCASADLNDDGSIGEDDLSLLLGQFGSLGFSFTTPQFTCSIDPNCNSGQNSIQMCSLICTKTN